MEFQTCPVPLFKSRRPLNLQTNRSWSTDVLPIIRHVVTVFFISTASRRIRIKSDDLWCFIEILDLEVSV
jgi:hypothetical protein